MPLDVLQLLAEWGEAIYRERSQQRITVRDFALRINVSTQTLARIERGDSAAQAGTYLAALWALGLLNEVAPPLPQALLLLPGSRRGRVRKPPQEPDDGL